MKKLLSLLSVLTISGTSVPTTIAASPYQKEETIKNSDINYLQTNNLENLKINKQELSLNDYLEFNNKYIEKINNENINIDNIDNGYFTTNEGLFVVKNGETTATKINEINISVNSILNDSNNNIYFGTDNGAWILKNGETTATKINEINIRVNSILNDSNNNIYFGTDNGAWILKNGESTITKINEINNQIFTIRIDSNNNIYFGGNGDSFVLKNEELIPIKIIFETAVKKIIFDTFDNVYFTSSYGAYIFKKDAINAIKISEIGETYVNSVQIDSNNNIYFGTDNGAWILKNGETTATKINGIDINDPINLVLINNNNNNVYLNGDQGIYLLKHNEINSNKVLGLNNYINSIVIDNNNDVYLGTDYGAWILKNGESTITKINGIKGNVFLKKNIKNNFIFLKNKNNLFILKNKEIKIEKIKNINDTVYSVIFDKKNNVYFNTLDSVYFLEFGKIEPIKIFTDEEYKNTEIFIDNFDNFYIKNYISIYLYKNMEIIDLKIKEMQNIVLKQKSILNKNLTIDYKEIEKITKKIYTSFTDKKNNIYFLTYTGFYIIKNGDVLPILINGTEEFFPDYGLNNYIFDENENNIYFTANDSNNTQLYFFKKNDDKIKINKIINISDNVSNILITNDNNMYITTWKNSGGTIYVLKNGETTATKIIEIPNQFSNIILDNIGNLYFTTANSHNNNNNNGIYTIKNKLNFQDIIKITNLEKIENNEDGTILNKLNYLNRENNYFLNLNKIKVINKTSTSATIEAIKGKYRGQVIVNYKIKNKDEINNIDLNDLLKKAVYFYFINKNFYTINKIKEIKDINTDNLNFKNVEVTRRNNTLKPNINFKKDICFHEREHTNSSSVKKTVKIPKCQYNQNSKLMFQIITGINTDGQDNTQNGWTLNIDDENKLWDFINLNYQNQTITQTLSKEFDFTNLNKQEQEMIFVFNEPEDEIELAPNEKVTFAYSTRESKYESILNLKQNITGNITTKIIDDDNEEETISLSIKEAMQILQKYSLLLDEININEDNSITFNGKAIFSRISESKPKLDINTSLI